jgi:uncharacterized membrane protein (DUF4010 family)
MNIFDWTTELRFAVALALGFLVGLERESTKVEGVKISLGGVRTFPILSLLGFGCAWLSKSGATLSIPLGLLAVTVLAAITYIEKIKEGHYGSTSEVSAILTFVVGALALLTDVWIPMALAITNTILLSEKTEIESYVDRLSRVEFLATLKFLLVTLIILPALPNQEFTRFKLNPAAIWKIVILVSSIGFVGYILSKKFGEKLGLWLSGVLGGIVSSTAVTIAVGRIGRNDPEQSGAALQSSILASSIMYLRILILISVINSGFVSPLWWRLLALMLIGIVLSVRFQHNKKGPEPGFANLQNPFELKPAIIFAALFVLLSIVTTLVREQIGTNGVLGLSAVVGVTDIDPFILSLIQGTVGVAHTITLAIIIAMMSNTIAKGIYFWTLVPSIRKETSIRYGLWAALHLPFLFL